MDVNGNPAAGRLICGVHISLTTFYHRTGQAQVVFCWLVFWHSPLGFLLRCSLSMGHSKKARSCDGAKRRSCRRCGGYSTAVVAASKLCLVKLTLLLVALSLLYCGDKMYE